MRVVPVKSAARQATLMLPKTRALPIKQRTMGINALRGYLSEFGMSAAKGIGRLERVPIRWNHLIDKDAAQFKELKFKELEHVGIEKGEQLFCKIQDLIHRTLSDFAVHPTGRA